MCSGLTGEVFRVALNCQKNSVRLFFLFILGKEDDCVNPNLVVKNESFICIYKVIFFPIAIILDSIKLNDIKDAAIVNIMHPKNVK